MEEKGERRGKGGGIVEARTRAVLAVLAMGKLLLLNMDCWNGALVMKPGVFGTIVVWCGKEEKRWWWWWWVFSAAEAGQIGWRTLGDAAER